MARKVLTILITTLMLYGCGSTVHVRVDHRVPPPIKRVRYAYIDVIKDSPRFKNVTVVIDERIRFNLKEVNRRNRPLDSKQVKVQPGVHYITVFHKGRVIYERRINVPPGRTYRVRI